MSRQLFVASLFLVASLISCARPSSTSLFTFSEDFEHIEYDTPEKPFQAKFEAPHGGYLFPFQDMVIEVQFGKNGAVQIFLYDEIGNWAVLDDSFRKAFLGVRGPGFSVNFGVIVFRQDLPHRFAGRFSLTEVPRLIRDSDTLHFRFALPDARKNYTRTQCHGGHWAEAILPKIPKGHFIDKTYEVVLKEDK